ncbi:hypothetical protein ST398NM02_2992 [Staphylococcus aureus subsp. aureus DR10]|uniref:Uncharacterized protein n=1 Tax=Staphylococcus aureus subsp. aureus DR10 TaxID=1155079 RepID=A0ABC9PXJ4_STAA5|nr:hypothetical protein ST398NM01_2992 [Staphylococcus aureus subsp. aureus 71193]EIA13193.1 hypothetical protein ST398NM02_2992 [Staphylococcus aureus subsp. aureus DR10]
MKVNASLTILKICHTVMFTLRRVSIYANKIFHNKVYTLHFYNS